MHILFIIPHFCLEINVPSDKIYNRTQ